MKYKFLLSILFITSFTNAQSLFDTSVLHEIRVTSTETNLWDLLTSDYDNNYPDVPYQSVTVEIDGNTLENVGVRQKGFSSHFFCDTNKKPLKINFGKFVDGQKYDKVKKINLANGIGDPAIVKDKIAYDMYRQHGIPAPRVSLAKIYIQDVYWGIYAIIEQIDKRFLKRNFADKTGNLWKNKDNSQLHWQGTNPDNYDFELQTNETENDWSKFIEFIDFINNTTDTEFKNGIENIFDLDEYLRIIAIDILTNNWDSYIEHGRNWYLYHEPKTNKMHWLPWDYNFAFDRYNDGSGDFPMLLNNSEKILIYRTLQVPEFKERYLNYMCEILAINFTESRLYPKLDAHLDLIDDWDTATNNFFSFSDVQNGINGNLWDGGPMGGSFQGIKKYITERTITMEADLADEAYTCLTIPPAINEYDIVINEFMAQNLEGSIWFDQDNEHDDWVELYNNTANTISLKNYFLSDSPSFIHKWEFPEDTNIPAHDYLIVWTDKDPQQTGLHSKFNLDKNGDELILSYLDGTIIDSVDYTEEQEDNKSLSRIPNGTGDFIVADVTFNTLNSNISAGVFNDTQNYEITVYPNPAKNELKISFNQKPNSKVRIINSLGQEVFQSKNIKKTLDVNISNWKTGVYFIRITDNNYSISKKFIVN
jgi:hypothetical protein